MTVFITFKECNVPLVFLWLDSKVVVILSARTLPPALPFLVFQFWQTFPKLLVNIPAWCPGSSASREPRTAWRKPESEVGQSTEILVLPGARPVELAMAHNSGAQYRQSDSLVPRLCICFASKVCSEVSSLLLGEWRHHKLKLPHHTHSKTVFLFYYISIIWVLMIGKEI